MAAGVDTLGEEWAKENNIPVDYFPANWETHGRAAGQIRNKKMAARADALLLIWDGKSRGSRSMLNIWQGLHGMANMVIIDETEYHATTEPEKRNDSS